MGVDACDEGKAPRIGLLPLSLAGASLAGEFAYTCEVRHLYHLEMDGRLTSNSADAVERMMKEHPFAVSRETGALTGNSVNLDTSMAKTTRVIKRGSNANSFEAVADFGDFVNGSHPFQFLTIKEFREGAIKPFVLMGTNGVITGTCR
jgi:hypothetical protein